MTQILSKRLDRLLIGPGFLFSDYLIGQSSLHQSAEAILYPVRIKTMQRPDQAIAADFLANTPAPLSRQSLAIASERLLCPRAAAPGDYAKRFCPQVPGSCGTSRI